jgi:hypothetical protein
MTTNGTPDVEGIRAYIEHHGATYLSHRMEGDELIVSMILPSAPEMVTFDVETNIKPEETE